MKETKLLKYIILGIVAALVAAFMLSKRKSRKGHPHDYAEAAANGTLRAATEYNPIGFCMDRDTLSGSHYELIEAFTRDYSLQVAIAPGISFNKRLEGLAEGRYDVIAYGFLVTSELKDSLLPIAPIVLNRQVLVQYRMGSPDDSLFIRSQFDLAGKTLSVIKGFPSILRIRNLGNEIGDTICINEVEKYGSKQLIVFVMHGDIDCAIYDEVIVRSAADSLPQIDINIAISSIQFYPWGVSKQFPAPLDSLNSWLERFKTRGEYKKIYRKYYK